MSGPKPILFSGEMVRALLDGRKTQTRRVVKPKPDEDGRVDCHHGMAYLRGDRGGQCTRMPCPYGQPGDLLYVKETWGNFQGDDGPWIAYRATEDEDGPWRPSIHMPRWASRMTLRLTDVRVERVQDISASDAAAEGVRYDGGSYEVECFTPASRERKRLLDYRALWDSLNAKRGHGWEANPWVWVLEFETLKQNVDEVTR